MNIDLAKLKVAGSAEEVRDIGLNVERIYTCGPERLGVKGCPLYARCTRPEKDKVGYVTWTMDGQKVKPGTDGAVREGPGPLNLGVQRWKRTGELTFKVINGTLACWEFQHQKANWQAVNTGAEEPRAGMKIVAIEGEKIHLNGSLPVVQEDNRVIHVRQMEGIETLIKPMPRPSENPAFARSAFAIAELTREASRIQDGSLGDFVKLRPGGEDADLELDGPAVPVAGKSPGGASSRG